MSVQTQARQPVGIPVGGQFAAVHHTEPDLTLTSVPSDDLSVEDLSWMGEDELRVAKGWMAVLGVLGVKGRLDELAVDGRNMEGQLTTPEGSRLGFHLSPQAADLWRNDHYDLDPAHGDASMVSRAWDASGEGASAAITEAFATARSRARVADAWMNRTHLRSTEGTRFGLPELATENGRQIGVVELGTPAGDYRVVIGRGGFEAEVYNSDGVQLSRRMATAILLDASEDGAGTADADEVKCAVIRSLEAELGELW